MNLSSRRSLLFIKTAWIILTLASLSVLLAGMPVIYARLSTACEYGSCTYFQLEQSEVRALRQVNLTLSFYAVYMILVASMVTIGSLLLSTLVFWWKSASRMAILLSFSLLGLSQIFIYAQTQALVDYNPSWKIVVGLFQLIGSWGLIVFSYVFPDGRFFPRWTRWFALVLTILEITSLLTSRTNKFEVWESSSYQLAVSLILMVCTLAGVYAQVTRYRRLTDPVQRQQIKWIVYGFAILAVGTFTFYFSPLIFPQLIQDGIRKLGYNLIGGGLSVVFVLLFLGSLTIAVLKYRLWEIDVIIRRSMIYTALTGALALIYITGVVLLQQVFPDKSSISTILTTLLVATLFNPLRRRIQDFIDRRFYRRKYDAAAVLAGFTAAARDEVDIDRLSSALLYAVRETMQPASVSLWLRSGVRREEWSEIQNLADTNRIASG